jgi:hemerythrin superfamily protein
MDIARQLQSDHDAMLRLSRRVARTKDTQQAKAHCLELRALLRSHSRAEEEIVYPALDALGLSKLALATDEGMVEHGLCDHLAGRLVRANSDRPLWKARAMVLHELLEHHLQEENDEMLPVLRAKFDAPARAALGEHFERRKARWLQATGRAARAG